MFEIKNVSKQYNGAFALNNISLNIGRGLNFIIGASGSGKTTLLKIISGMEEAFDGDVFYCGKSIKSLSSNEKAYFYNNILGFIWQDFNLLEDSTVFENVLLPQYLKNNHNEKNAEMALKDLKIFNIANQKVKYLSGGQKQRVAIARELMKNPQVIIADEPTSALDKNTSKTIMDALRVLAKTRTVVVVTHDTSFIKPKDHVIELDKGELVSKPEITFNKMHEIKIQNKQRFSVKNAFTLTKSNIKNKFGQFTIATLTLVIASILLLTTISGSISGSSQGEFDKLIETYGESLTDIGLYNSFMDASGTDGKENNKPSGNVNQDISGLYDLYAKDDRVSFIAYLQAFNDIKITVDGKEHQIKSSGSAPTINKLVAGKMPMGDKNEVVVPESFVKSLGISADEAIGKEINFNSSVYNWSSGQPVPKKTSTTATVVGVMDTTVAYDYEGEINTYTVDDAFIFSKSALDEMGKKAGIDVDKMNFLLRAKTPADMIAIKDELNEKGIVPLGRFELVEDMVRLNNQTTKQSGSVSVIIGILSLFMVVAVFLITGFLRKKEYAIYKVSGFTTAHLFSLNLVQTLSSAVAAIVVMLITSPLLNFVTKWLFGADILNVNMLLTGFLLIIVNAVIAYFTTVVTFAKVNISSVLKTGDR